MKKYRFPPILPLILVALFAMIAPPAAKADSLLFDYTPPGSPVDLNFGAPPTGDGGFIELGAGVTPTVGVPGISFVEDPLNLGFWDVNVDVNSLVGFTDLQIVLNNNQLCIAVSLNQAPTFCVVELKIPVKKSTSSGSELGLDENNDSNANSANTSTSTEDPISLATGEYYFTDQFLNLRGPVLPMTFGMYYGTRFQGAVIFDHMPHFFDSTHTLIARKSTLFGGFFIQLSVRLGMGEMVSFEQDLGTGDWIQEPGERWAYSVEETTNFYYLKSLRDQRVYIFEKHPVGTDLEPAYCIEIQDRNGNALSYAQPVDPTLSGPSSVTDGLGRTLNFTYAPTSGATVDLSSYLTQVMDHDGRSVTLLHEEVGGVVRLKTLTDANGGVYSFAYDTNNLLTGKTMPEGNTPFTQTYVTEFDFFFNQTLGRAVSQSDALGHTWTLEEKDGIVGLGDVQFVWTNPDGSQQRHFHSDDGVLSARVDETGELASFTGNDDQDHFTGYTDRDGETASYTYFDPSGAIASKTDERGNTTTYTYTESAPQNFTNPKTNEVVQCTFFDLTRIDYADGTSHIFTYDPQGNQLTSTDRDGDTRSATYNARGQRLTSTNPENGIRTRTYDNATGLIDTRTDTDTGVYSFEYDALSRRTKTTLPDTSERTYAYDALDRIISRTSEDTVITTFAYDKNSNLTERKRAVGTPEEQIYQYEYDARDRLVKTTDPAGETTQIQYPYFDQPERIVLRDGSTIEYEYDARRLPVKISDEAGLDVLLGYSPESRLTSLTTPVGRTTKLERDPEGALLKTTDNSGDTFERAVDVFSREIATRDGLSRESTCILDGEGRKISRTEPRVGTTTYQYDDNGRLTQLTDARTKSWDMTYTEMGRLTGVTDPDARSETRTYDNRGRLKTRTHPDAVIETLTYDPDSTLQNRSYSDGLQHTYSYDPLNRLTQQTRSLGADTDTCTYSYDVRSSVINTTVNGLSSTATYDVRDRLKTLTLPDGSTTVTYTYDARSLVTRVTDSLTGATIDCEYNADRQLTKTTRSNGHVTTYSYDDEGLMDIINHDTGANIDFDHNRADEPTTIADTGFPLDAAASLIAGTENQSFNDSSEITSGAYAYDNRGRPSTDGSRTYTWDSNDRLIQVVTGGNTIQYRYDCAGRITSRDENGSITQYGYNAALGRQPIIAEQESGAFTRFYVTLPSGQMLYAIEDPAGSASVHFYHFGNTGNTRFLTDAGGAVTDSYAYDAYGRLLAQSGSSDQIYTFVGSLGVRNDAAAGLSHMHHRYYDANSRRFVSRDPIFLRLMSRKGLEANPYHYVAGQPTRRVDPSGLDDDFLFMYWKNVMQETEYATLKELKEGLKKPQRLEELQREQNVDPDDSTAAPCLTRDVVNGAFTFGGITPEDEIIDETWQLDWTTLEWEERENAPRIFYGGVSVFISEA